MSAAFQHVVTLLSFVLALGVSHQLFTAVEIVRAGPRVKLSWVHGIWMANCFLGVIAWWIGIWDFHAIANWPVLSILYNLLAVLCVFLAIAFVCPRLQETETLDLWEFHLEHRKQYIAFTVASAAIATGDSLYYGYGYGVSGQGIQAVILTATAVFAAVALFTPNARVQLWVALAVNALYFMFFFVGDPVLS
jgi:hypothetical protein